MSTKIKFMSSVDARKQFFRLLNEVYFGKSEVIITKHNKAMVRMISEESERKNETLKNGQENTDYETKK